MFNVTGGNETSAASIIHFRPIVKVKKGSSRDEIERAINSAYDEFSEIIHARYGDEIEVRYNPLIVYET